MAQTSELKSKNINRTDQIIRDAIDYVFFDRSPEEKALMMMEVRTKNIQDVEALSDILNEEMGETFMRHTFADLLFKMKFGIGLEDKLQGN